MKIMLIEEDDSERRSILHRTLCEEKHKIIRLMSNEHDLFQSANEIDPDMIVINVEKADGAMLAQLKLINEAYPKPIVIFSDNSDSNIIQAAVDSGVSAFIVDGLIAQRIPSILEVAIARFKNYSSLRQELEKTKQNLNNRKVIEKAKGLIIKQKQCSEDEAYQMLRKLAMDKNLKLVDVANNVIEVSSLMM